jgi:hypothetical protein
MNFKDQSYVFSDNRNLKTMCDLYECVISDGRQNKEFIRDAMLAYMTLWSDCTHFHTLQCQDNIDHFQLHIRMTFS